jgi:hypothetical protein
MNMNLPTTNTLLTYVLTLCIALSLISSFGLHAVQIGHIHPGHQEQNESSHQHQNEHESGEFSVLGEYMHAADKKLYLLIASVWSLSSEAISFLYGDWLAFLFAANLLFIVLLQRNRKLLLTAGDYIKVFLARGILNPKLY